jgi:hypothetical protein
MAAYSVPFAAGTMAVGFALAWVNPAASPSASLRIIRCLWGQSSSAVSANLSTKMFSKITAFPTCTGTTPEPLHRTGRISAIVSGGVGAAGTSGVLATAGAGTETTIHADAPNNLNGWLWVPQLGDSYLFDAGSTSGFGFSITSTPIALTGFSGGLYFNEE